MQLWSDEEETELANPGENVRVKLKNIEEEVSTVNALLKKKVVSERLQCDFCFVWTFSAKRSETI